MSIQLSRSIIRQLTRKNSFGFRFQDVVGEFPDVNPVYLARSLSEMVRKGILKKISRNTYHYSFKFGSGNLCPWWASVG